MLVKAWGTGLFWRLLPVLPPLPLQTRWRGGGPPPRDAPPSDRFPPPPNTPDGALGTGGQSQY